MIPILKSYWYYKCSTTHYSLWVQLWTNPHPKFHVANCVDGEPSRAHNLEWATLWCPCNGIFTNQFIFRSTSHKFLTIKYGPLHMSPVDRADPLTGTNLTLKKMRNFSPNSKMRKRSKTSCGMKFKKKKQTWQNT